MTIQLEFTDERTGAALSIGSLLLLMTAPGSGPRLPALLNRGAICDTITPRPKASGELRPISGQPTRQGHTEPSARQTWRGKYPAPQPGQAGRSLEGAPQVVSGHGIVGRLAVHVRRLIRALRRVQFPTGPISNTSRTIVNKKPWFIPGLSFCRLLSLRCSFWLRFTSRMSRLLKHLCKGCPRRSLRHSAVNFIGCATRALLLLTDGAGWYDAGGQVSYIS